MAWVHHKSPLSLGLWHGSSDRHLLSKHKALSSNCNKTKQNRNTVPQPYMISSMGKNKQVGVGTWEFKTEIMRTVW
jgi:hypothetical protein